MDIILVVKKNVTIMEMNNMDLKLLNPIYLFKFTFLFFLKPIERIEFENAGKWKLEEATKKNKASHKLISRPDSIVITPKR